MFVAVDDREGYKEEGERNGHTMAHAHAVVMHGEDQLIGWQARNEQQVCLRGSKSMSLALCGSLGMVFR